MTATKMQPVLTHLDHTHADVTLDTLGMGKAVQVSEDKKNPIQQTNITKISIYRKKSNNSKTKGSEGKSKAAFLFFNGYISNWIFHTMNTLSFR